MSPVCLPIGCSPSAYFHYWTANQWVTACLEVMGAFVVLAVALLGVYADPPSEKPLWFRRDAAADAYGQERPESWGTWNADGAKRA